MLSWSIFVQGKLVVDVEDLDSLDATYLEKEAILIETILRKTDCEGVTV